MEAYAARARGDIVVMLLAEPCRVAYRCQQISAGYLAPEMPDSSGRLSMRFMVQSVVMQAEHAAESNQALA